LIAVTGRRRSSSADVVASISWPEVAAVRRAISFPSSQMKNSSTAGTRASAHWVRVSSTVPNRRRRTSQWAITLRAWKAATMMNVGNAVRPVNAGLGVALGMDKQAPGLRTLKPRSRDATILTKGLLTAAGLVGLFMAVLSRSDVENAGTEECDDVSDQLDDHVADEFVEVVEYPPALFHMPSPPRMWPSASGWTPSAGCGRRRPLSGSERTVPTRFLR
jgi:hypothetical protein